MSDDFPSAPPAPEMPPAPPAPPMAPPVAPMGGDAPSDTGKLLAGFGYLIGIVALIAILVEPYSKEHFVRHHAVQALGLWVAGIVLGVLANIPILGWIVALVGGVALAVFTIIGTIKAFTGQYYEVPVVYNIVKQYI